LYAQPRQPTRRNASGEAGRVRAEGRRMEVVLPDVTGLTSAVESPVKGDPRKTEYLRDERARGEEG